MIQKYNQIPECDNYSLVYLTYFRPKQILNILDVHGVVYSIQHYVIKFVNDFGQVGGFLRVLPFPPPIKLTTMISGVKHHKPTKPTIS